MAGQLGISRYSYRLMEEDSRECEFKPSLETLAQREQCYILRLRAGWSLQEGADRMDISRWWLRRMERGDAPVARLWRFWNK